MIDVRVEDLAFYSGHAVIRPATATLDATTPLLRRFELAGGAALRGQLRIADPLPVGSAMRSWPSRAGPPASSNRRSRGVVAPRVAVAGRMTAFPE